MGMGSGCKAREHPLVALQAVCQTIMQAGRTPLPELHTVRHHAVATPVRGPLWVVTQILGEFGIACLECFAADRLALRRHPGSDARTQGAAAIVFVRLFRAGLLDTAFDAHLALERLPEEEQRGARVTGEFQTFTGLVVGEEDEAALIEAFEQHDAR